MFSKTANKKLKWHQKWWGVVILVILALLLISGAVIVYRILTLYQQISTPQQTEADLSNILATNPNYNVEAFLQTEDDPYWGPKDAEIILVEFSDFQCAFCEQAFPILQKIRQDYKDKVKIIYRDYINLKDHPDALNAAMAAECSQDQNFFWPYHDLLFSNQQDLSLANLKRLAAISGMDTEKFNACLDSQKYYLEVMNDVEDAAKLNVTGTPTFFINGARVTGVQTYETFVKIINAIEAN